MSYKFIQNIECEYFPCHKNIDIENFNCLFCYCPLYALGDGCGGNPTYTSNGVKSCMECEVVHHKSSGYEHVQNKMKNVISLVKKS